MPIVFNINPVEFENLPREQYRPRFGLLLVLQVIRTELISTKFYGDIFIGVKRSKQSDDDHQQLNTTTRQPECHQRRTNARKNAKHNPSPVARSMWETLEQEDRFPRPKSDQARPCRAHVDRTRTREAAESVNTSVAPLVHKPSLHGITCKFRLRLS